MIGKFTLNLIKICGLFPSRFLLQIQIFNIFFTFLYHGLDRGFYHIFVRKEPYKFDNYIVIDFIQCEIFYIIQIFLYRKVHKSKDFYEKILKMKSFKIDRRIDRKIKTLMSLILIARLLKSAITIREFPAYFLFFTKSIFPEFAIVVNDLFFVALIDTLKIQLKTRKFLISRLKSINKQVFDIYLIEKEIMDNFSKNLLLTISYNYFQLIICLYWIFIRIRFHDFKYIRGKLC